jgi:bifunctional enzyme CysN/CysC
MVTGASTASLAVVLVDARKGVLEQTKRHAFISTLLRVPHLVLCVNKMDLVGWDEAVFEHIRDEFAGFSAKLDIADLTFIPISALHGDNVVARSPNMPWYEGPPLLHHLEHVHVASDRNLVDCRFPVQWVIRPNSDEHHDFRGYSGQIASGTFRPGDEVLVLPAGKSTRIASIETLDGPLTEAEPPMSVTMRLEDELDISRGDLICRPHNAPAPARELDAMLCWMGEQELRPGRRYAIKHTTRSARAVVDELQYRVDVDTLHREQSPDMLGLNQIGRVRLRTSSPLLVDEYRRNRTTGSFILMDEATNDTLAGGMVLGTAA